MKARPQSRPTRWTLEEWQQPAGATGGDFVITRWRESGVRVFVADVTGHGAEATAMARIVRGLIEPHADDEITAALLAGWSNTILARFSNRFVCLTYMELDFNTRRATIFNAGNPPLIIRRGRHCSFEAVHATGMPLGIVESSSWSPPEFRQVSLDPEDTVVCFTDGLTDQTNRSRRHFGLERVLAAIAGNNGESPIRSLGRSIARFADGRAEQDDVTVLALHAQAA